MEDDEELIVVSLDEGEDQADAPANEPKPDPDEFFAKSAFRVVYQINNFLLPQIKDLIDKGEVLNLRPEYQRRLRWTTPQKSRLIESLLLNIPIPPVFLYESDAARYEVMDGQQRLNAVKEFLAGGYALSGLQVLKPLNGLRYLRCPPRVKRALDRASLSAIVLLLESEPAENLTLTDIRRFIFDRLNTGGTKLNHQEIRNAIYPGLFNDALIELSRYDKFTETFEIPPYTEANPNDYYENEKRQKNNLYSSMGDCQLILRYFALKDDANIRGSMKSMLDRAMQSRMEISAAEAKSLKNEFEETFAFLYDIFSEEPFRLPPDERGRERVSAALYDSSMVAMRIAWADRPAIKNDAAAVRGRLLAAMNDDDKLPLLTGQANTAQAVRDRIELMTSVLKG